MFLFLFVCLFVCVKANYLKWADGTKFTADIYFSMHMWQPSDIFIVDRKVTWPCDTLPCGIDIILHNLTL